MKIDTFLLPQREGGKDKLFQTAQKVHAVQALRTE